MFCCHCGKEIENDSRFCPHCGGEQPPVPGEGPKSGDFFDASGDGTKAENIIENAGETIGNGIDSAIKDLKNSDGAKALKNGVNEAGKKAEDIVKNWRDYLTVENMELAAPLLLLMPLVMGIVKMVLIRVFGILFLIPLIGTLLRFVLGLVKLVFVVASGAGIGAVGYVLYKKPEKRSLYSFVSLGAAVLGFLSCLGMFFYWKHVNLPFGLLALVWGAESIARVCIQKKGMESEPNVQEDIEAYKNFYNDLRAKMKQAEGDKAAGAGAAAGVAGAATVAGAASAVDGAMGADETIKGFDPDAAGSAAGGVTGDSVNGYVPAPVVPTQGGESYFDGSGIELFGILLLTFILSGITCGLATPWMLCKIFKWRKTHTVIDGRRLDFNGTGGNLFGHWILWEILTAVTCGIYGFFMYVAVRKWEMKHTFYQDQPEMQGSFDGNSFQYLGYGLLQGLLVMLTCGIAAPWTITMIEKWQMKHSVVANDRMRYDGTGLGLLGQYLIFAILSAITCGIYLPWGIVRLDKYLFSHVHVDETFM